MRRGGRPRAGEPVRLTSPATPTPPARPAGRHPGLAVFAGPLLFAASTILALVACEAFARARIANPYRHYPPGTVTRMTTPEYDVEIAINRDGFRDRDHERRKRPGVLRVAVIGDSFTWGSGVALEAAFPGRLEALLDSALAADPPASAAREFSSAEVMNFGVTWTGPVQYLRVWKGIASRYRPDVVVVAAYAGNDMADAHREASQRPPRSALLALVRGLGAPKPTEAGAQFGWKSPGAENPANLPALVRAGAARGVGEETIRARWDAVPESLRTEAAAFRINPYNLAEAVVDPGSIVDNLLLSGAEARDGCARSREALDALAADARARGARPLLAVIPAAVQVDRDEWWVGRLGFRLDERLLTERPVQDTLAAIGAARGVPVVDLLPLFRARAGETLFYEQDAHWNAAGHEIAARALAPRVLETLETAAAR